MRYGKLGAAVAAVLFVGAMAHAQEVDMTNEDSKGSYALGAALGEVFAGEGSPLNIDAFVQGLKDSGSGGELKLPKEEIQSTAQSFQRKVMESQEARLMAESEKMATENLQKANEFLAANKSAEGVKTTESGLQYQVIKEGEGTPPTATDTVTVHYTGTLIDGSKFDSSRDRGEPTSFPLNRVIPGWTEGLQLMKPGAQYIFWIPAELAYGEQGRPGIPPNSMLKFDVELIKVGE